MMRISFFDFCDRWDEEVIPLDSRMQTGMPAARPTGAPPTSCPEIPSNKGKHILTTPDLSTTG
jgi:hypothetical protein